MTTEPFTPHADSLQTAWVLMCQQSRISTQPPVEELEAEFDRFLARIRRDAVEEYKDRQVQIQIHPAPTRMVPVPVRCPKCGYR